MILRKLQPKDFTQVLTLIKNTPELSMMEKSEYISKTELSNLIKRNDAVSVVAVEGTKVLGFAYGVLEPTNSKMAWLYHLVVKKKERGKGLGSKLLKVYEKELKKRGVKRMLLYMHVKPELKKFYKRHGFMVGKIPLINAVKEF